MLTVAELARRARPRAGGGERGQPAAPIRWVHISELQDPTPWLSGGELMLTHRHPARHRRQAARLRATLAEHNLAGLGFGIGFSHAEPSRGARRGGGQARFPALRSALLDPVHRDHREGLRTLVNEQYEVLQRGLAIQRRLERLVLEERGLEEIAATIASAIGGTRRDPRRPRRAARRARLPPPALRRSARRDPRGGRSRTPLTGTPSSPPTPRWRDGRSPSR